MDYIKSHIGIIISIKIILISFILFSCVGQYAFTPSVLKSGNISFDTIPKDLIQDTLHNKEAEIANVLGSDQNCIDSIYSLNLFLESLNETLLNLTEQKDKISDEYDALRNDLKKIFGKQGHKAFEVKMGKNSFDCYEVDAKLSEVKFFLNDKNSKKIHSIDNLRLMLEDEGKILIFATNAGMFVENRDPKGLYIEDRKVLAPLHKEKGKYGNFYIEPNGVFYIDTFKIPGIKPTDEITKELINSLQFATQSGPMVVINNEINLNFKQNSEHLNIRSGVGINDNGNAIFVISNNKVNFYDFANLFKVELKCKNAIYLDGAISQTYIPEIGRMQLEGSFGPLIGIIKNAK